MRPTSGYAAALASLAFAAPALAQQAEPPESHDVVVITGIGPARISGELITSTSVLTSDAIVERLDGGLGDTLAGLPGVSSTSFGPGASRPIIRGLGAERVQVLTNGIGVIDASAASPDHAVTADPLGAERIEILRGPASLAYGGGATGGVINVIDGLIVDALPGANFSAKGYAAATSVDDGRQAAAKLTGAFGGQLVGVLNGAWGDAKDIDIPGFAFSETRRADEIANGANPADFARDALPNSFAETSALSGGLSWVGDKGFIGGAVRRLDNTYGIVAEEEAFIDMEQTRYDLRGGLSFDGPVRSVTVTGSSVDYEHTEFEDAATPGTTFTSEGWEARIEAKHGLFGPLEGSFGLQASDRDLAAIGAEALIDPTTTKQAGVFIFETLDRETWGIEGGLRYDDVELNNLNLGKRSFDAVNASFGGHLHLSDAVFLGLSASRTERAPTDLELFADGPHPATAQFEVGDDTLGTEKGVNLEATLRLEAARAHLDVSIYNFAFDDFIYLADTGVIDTGDPLDPEDDLPVFAYTQDDASFTGFEIAGDVSWGRFAGADWSTDASFSLVRAKLDAGGNLPRIPAASGMVGLAAAWERWDARIEAEFAAKQDDVAAFETPTASYTVLNASLGFDVTDNLRLMLEAKNITDEEVRLHASPLKEIAPQPGRNFRVALRASF